MKDRSGNYVAPATRSSAVYMNNNQDLETYLNNMRSTLQDNIDSVNSSLTSKINAKPDKLTMYPVGAIYQSTGSTSPASLFGGDWERLYDRFLVGAGGTYGVGNTGGEASHILTNPELPTHHHAFANNSYTIGNGPTGWEGDVNLVIGGHEDYIVCFKNGPLGRPNAAFASSNQHNHTLGAGDNAPHNNLPPYYAVNIWRRTA